MGDYYTHALSSQKADAHRVARAGSLAAFLSALVVAAVSWHLLPTDDHALSAGVVLGAMFFVFATAMLTRPVRHSHATLVGYSSSGLPLYASQRRPPSIVEALRPILGKILENQDSRRIFYFLLLNLVGGASCCSYSNQSIVSSERRLILVYCRSKHPSLAPPTFDDPMVWWCSCRFYM